MDPKMPDAQQRTADESTAPEQRAATQSAESAGHTGRSPWTPLNGVKSVRISPPSITPQVHMAVPGSKSFTNRALLLAAMAEGPSVVEGVLRSDDSYWCYRALESLGIKIEMEKSGDGEEAIAHVTGCGGVWPKASGEIFTGSSGTLSRFLPAALAVGKGDWELKSTPQMARRPVGPLLDAMMALGAQVDYLGDEGYYPFRLQASGLRGGPVDIPGDVSSQYLSALMMGSPYAEREVLIRVTKGLVQPAYIDLTMQLMAQFGVEVEELDELDEVDPLDHAEGRSGDTVIRTFAVKPQHYRGGTVRLEADASTAGYFFALAAVTGGRVRVVNLGHQTVQPDIRLVDVLEQMGCTVIRGEGWTEVQGPGQLRGGFTADLRDMSDQALTIGVVSVFADAPVTVTGVGHVRQHESDRIAAIHHCLEKCGIRVDEQEDGFTVYPGTPVPPAAEGVPTFDDHRVAMAIALIGAVVPGLTLDDPGCVSKTCPEYFEFLAGTGVGVDYVHER